MNKQTIRLHYKVKRASLKMEQRIIMHNAIIDQFHHLHLDNIKVLHHYLAVKEQYEISVEKILDIIQVNAPNIIKVVPVMKGEDMLSVVYHNNMSVTKNQWGIEEPVDHIPIDDHAIDCVLVPLLAFDKKGNRVGYGKGCYDRFLAKCRTDVIKIGFSFFPPVESIDDTDKFDIPLSFCITPDRIYEFG